MTFFIFISYLSLIVDVIIITIDVDEPQDGDIDVVYDKMNQVIVFISS